MRFVRELRGLEWWRFAPACRPFPSSLLSSDQVQGVVGAAQTQTKTTMDWGTHGVFRRAKR